MNKKRQMLIKVWKDTQTKCLRNIYGNLIINDSILFKANDERFNFTNLNKKYDKTHVTVLNEDVLVVAETLHNLDANKIMVLNMASYYKNGGGVSSGCMSQEEELFRRTNYFMSLDDKFYPLKKGEAIYTKNVYIIKDNMYSDLKKPFTVSMIAIAALKNPQLDVYGLYTQKKYYSMCNIIENIFRVSYFLGYENLVLGSLGCGAYSNPSEEVAKIFNIYLKKYDCCFKTIIFAVLSKHDKNFDNFDNIIIKSA